MKTLAQKPFEYGCVVKGDFFCPRPDEEADLCRYMESGQNVVVVGERRMGKTSLIMTAFANTKKHRMLYVDLLNIRTISDFCDRVASAAARMGRGGSFVHRTLSFLARLRPTLSMDSQNGMPVVSVDSHLAEGESSFDDVIAMIEKFAEKERVVVAFDEFQEVLKLESHEKALARLRARIQFLPETCFVFSGSVRSDMVSIFTDYRSPFYKSAATLDVGPIDDNRLIAFLKRRFDVGHRNASEDFLRKVIDVANHVSGDVQQLCDAIWMESTENADLSSADLDNGIKRILKQEGDAFVMQTQGLTRYQMKALAGIARMGGQHPFSADFITTAGLSSAPTAKRALMALVGMGILYLHNGEYKIFNPFLREWLKRRM